MLTEGEYLLQSILTAGTLPTLNSTVKPNSTVPSSAFFTASPIPTCWNGIQQQADTFGSPRIFDADLLNILPINNTQNCGILLQVLQMQQILQQQQQLQQKQQQQQQQQLSGKQSLNYENLLLTIASLQQLSSIQQNFSKSSLSCNSFPTHSNNSDTPGFLQPLNEQPTNEFEQSQEEKIIQKTEPIKSMGFSILNSASTSRNSSPTTDFSFDKAIEAPKIHNDDDDCLIKRKRKLLSSTESSPPSAISPCSNSSRNKAKEFSHPLKKKSKLLKKRLHSQDTVTNSPVSGMFIKEECTLDELQKAAELDDTASYVHISEESRQRISEIPNVIGDSICSLCKVKFEDVFRLAMHRCPRIVHEEYRCPECDKIFSCPANLASHRRWHKPRSEANDANIDDNNNPNSTIIGRTSNSNVCVNCCSSFTSKKLFKEHKRSCASRENTKQSVLSNDIKRPLPKINNTNDFDIYADIKEAKERIEKDYEQPIFNSKSAIAAAALISLGISPPKTC